MTLIAVLASLTLLGYPAWYLILCAVAPFGRCHRCAGTGHRRTITGRRGPECHRCDGTGRRVRIGRRLFDYFRTEHDRGNR
ncbi:hypothetical protein [Micromonospora sp. NPDC004704]